MTARPRILERLGLRLSRWWRREDGTATIEFTIFVPITIFIFMASMEAGLYMVRHVMMERGLDLVIREFRLGRLVSLNNSQLRDRICEATPMIFDCQNRLKVWMEPIDTTTFDIPVDEVYCADRNGQLNKPPIEGRSDQGIGDQIVLVRVCALERPIFPTTGIAVRLRADSVTGAYELYTATFAVSEPR